MAGPRYRNPKADAPANCQIVNAIFYVTHSGCA